MATTTHGRLKSDKPVADRGRDSANQINLFFAADLTHNGYPRSNSVAGRARFIPLSATPQNALGPKPNPPNKNCIANDYRFKYMIELIRQIAQLSHGVMPVSINMQDATSNSKPS
jgi:hypothetical protein